MISNLRVSCRKPGQAVFVHEQALFLRSKNLQPWYSARKMGGPTLRGNPVPRFGAIDFSFTVHSFMLN